MNHFHTSEYSKTVLLTRYQRLYLTDWFSKKYHSRQWSKGYMKCSAPKRIFWPKFPLTLGCLSIPTCTWELELSDHIVSLKLVFSSKRQHDPKGIVDTHLKQNHFKVGYIHEVVPDDFIYQGVDTFSEVLARAKSKEEKIQILLYQKEVRDRV